MLKKLTSCWPAWLILIITIIYFTLVPVRGIIGPVELPQDDAFLPEEDVQWWYWTGHLEDENKRKFGFEVVFFTFDSFLIFKNQLIQAAITDVKDNSFHFEEHVRFLSLPEKLPNAFNLTSGGDNKITAVGGGGSDTLTAQIGDYSLNLQLEESKEPVMHYGGGPHPYRFGGFTYYYSRVAMETSGTITINGETFKVSGSSWFDRQYGELYQAIFKGWQWFAIELDDDRQIMLYDINGKQNKGESYASITGPDGKTKSLGPDDFTVEILDHWQSPHTGCTYPSGWKLNIGEEEWIVEPMVKDQELRASHDFWIGPEYWEGASYVNSSEGKPAGKAYVELNGYCRELISD